MEKKLSEVLEHRNRMGKIDRAKRHIAEIREASTDPAEITACDYVYLVLRIERETARVLSAETALDSEDFINTEMQGFSNSWCADFFSEKAMIVEIVKEQFCEKQKGHEEIEKAKNAIRDMEEDIEKPEVKSKGCELIEKLIEEYGVSIYYSYYLTI